MPLSQPPAPTPATVPLARSAAGPRRPTLPPFSLPARHFLAATVWLAVGAVLLVAVAPALAAGNFATPRVVALTHCLTLGWVFTTIVGALYQVGPVALGAELRSRRLAEWTFVALTVGVGLVVAGAWGWWPRVLGAGWAVVVASFAAVSWNLVPPLLRSTRDRRVVRYVMLGFTAFGLAILVSATRIGVALGWWYVSPVALLVAHAHLGLIGFATMTTIGVSGRLLPMFLLSRGAREWPMRWIGPVSAAGLVLLVAGALGGAELPARAGALVIAVALAAYVWQVGEWFRTRTRPEVDHGLVVVGMAVGGLAAAAIAGVAVALTPEPPARLVAVYGVLLLPGWLGLIIAGIGQRILPFLTWMFRYGARAGAPGVPKPGELSIARLGYASGALMSAGVVVLASGILAGRSAVATAGSVVYALGVATLATYHGRLFRK